MYISESIKGFLDFVGECQDMNEMAKKNISIEEKRQQDLLHMIEFERLARERSKLCTRLHKSRIERRRNKDIFEETDDIVQLFSLPQHRKTLEQLRQVLGKVRKAERYHQDRAYRPRITEGGGSSQ